MARARKDEREVWIEVVLLVWELRIYNTYAALEFWKSSSSVAMYTKLRATWSYIQVS